MNDESNDNKRKLSNIERETTGTKSTNSCARTLTDMSTRLESNQPADFSVTKKNVLNHSKKILESILVSNNRPQHFSRFESKEIENIWPKIDEQQIKNKFVASFQSPIIAKQNTFDPFSAS